MSAAAHKTIDLDECQGSDNAAAGELIEHIRKAFTRLAAGEATFDETLPKWTTWMKELRSIEARMLESGPTPDGLRIHQDLVELMISLAAAVLSSAERDWHLRNEEVALNSSHLDLLRRYKRILEFELKGWHGSLSRYQMKKISQLLNSVSDSKAA